MKKKKRSAASQWARAFLIAFAILWLLHAFVAETAYVPNTSMAGTIEKADRVLIVKILNGARVPATMFSIPFTNFYFHIFSLPYLRTFRFYPYRHNQLIAFNYPVLSDIPVDKKPVIVKRIIGLPGDTIKIEGKTVFVNNKQLEESENMQRQYRITLKNSADYQNIVKEFHITDASLVHQAGVAMLAISKKSYEKIKQDGRISYISEKVMLQTDANELPLFPESKYNIWNTAYYGPLVVPSKGAKVKLDAFNLPTYKRIIEIYEKNRLEILKNAIYINGNKTSTYTFKMNYYFVLDDNRDYAKDSRYWGFLPEDHIIGTVPLVLFSQGSENYTPGWDRLLKFVQ